MNLCSSKEKKSFQHLLRNHHFLHFYCVFVHENVVHKFPKWEYNFRIVGLKFAHKNVAADEVIREGRDRDIRWTQKSFSISLLRCGFPLSKVWEWKWRVEVVHNDLFYCLSIILHAANTKHPPILTTLFFL